MHPDEVEVGMRVRYPRTGTTGNILALQVQGKETFAELDSTRLFYRVDQLVPVGKSQEKSKGLSEDTVEKIAKEREFYSGSGFQEAISHTDQSCEGGG
ncbi:MAG: DUF2098 domain-containing protein [Methanolinea sp.]|nr:DUF2098 domain-containing protein [Methanolinea sp.]